MSWWHNRSLRLKLALGISLTMLISLGIAFFAVSQYIQAQLWQRETQAAENLNAIAATLIEDAMMAGRKDKIHDALETLGQSVGGHIDSIAIYDDQSVLTSYVTGFPGGRSISQDSMLLDVTDPTCVECHNLPSEERPKMAVITLEGQNVIRNVVPLYNEPRCQTCHGTGITVLGDSIVDVRMDNYQRAVATITIGFGLGIAATIIFVAFVLYQLLRRIVISPIDELVEVTHSVVHGDLKQRVQVHNSDEIGQLGISFNSMTSQIGNLLGELEQRVANRTRALEERTAYLEASADVSRAATTVLEPDTLIQEVVDLIKERFNLYYVGLFLTDQQREWCILQAGTGKAGQIMLQSRHRIKVGEGMIGWSVANNQPRIALDVGMDAVRFDNPNLPDTRSECALPLRSRGKVLGALTVQSEKPSAFDQDIITVLQSMADQVAVGLENARLFAETEELLAAERRAYGELSRQAWERLLQGQVGYRYISDTQGIVRPTSNHSQAKIPEIFQQGRTIQADKATVVIPIKIRNQILGGIRLKKPNEKGIWTESEITLIENLTEQLGVALDSARLYEETQRSANQEQLIGEITTRMRETLNIETVLQTAAREFRAALDLAEVEVRMGAAIDDDLA